MGSSTSPVWSGFACWNRRGRRSATPDLAHLARIRSLGHLHLQETMISDAGLEHLAGMKQLRELTVRRTKSRPAGWRSWRRRCPTATFTPTALDGRRNNFTASTAPIAAGLAAEPVQDGDRLAKRRLRLGRLTEGVGVESEESAKMSARMWLESGCPASGFCNESRQ